MTLSISPFLRNNANRWPDLWDDDFFNVPASYSNSLEVYETENDIVVKANVAGVPVENVDITVDKDILWVRGEMEDEVEDDKKKHYSKASWSYSYKISIPGDINHNLEPEAKVKDGILTVTFKKAEQAKPKKLTIKKQ